MTCFKEQKQNVNNEDLHFNHLLSLFLTFDFVEIVSRMGFQTCSMLSLMAIAVVAVLLSFVPTPTNALLPFLDGGKGMPKLYNGWMDEQLAKQARTAVSKAVAAGKTKIEVNFPPVPNVEEVRFGTPLNQKFGMQVVAKDLAVQGGYRPGSEVSRQLIAYSNVYWAKQIAPALGLGKSVGVFSTEPVIFKEIKKSGVDTVNQLTFRTDGSKNDAYILCNPGGEETWDRFYSTLAAGSKAKAPPLVILNNAYSTTYDIGNKRGFEEAYYLKRISKGWVFRQFPDPWQALLEKPDGTVECLKTYSSKPTLKEAATLVREESFKRYAINNDRWTPGFGERL